MIAGERPGQEPDERKILAAVAGGLHGPRTVVVVLLAEVADTAVFALAAVDSAVGVDIVAKGAVLDFAMGDGAAAAGPVEDDTEGTVGVGAADIEASGCIVVEVDDAAVEGIHFPVVPKAATVVGGAAVVEAGLG